ISNVILDPTRLFFQYSYSAVTSGLVSGPPNACKVAPVSAGPLQIPIVIRNGIFSGSGGGDGFTHSVAGNISGSVAQGTLTSMVGVPDNSFQFTSSFTLTAS